MDDLGRHTFPVTTTSVAVRHACNRGRDSDAAPNEARFKTTWDRADTPIRTTCPCQPPVKGPSTMFDAMGFARPGNTLRAGVPDVRTD